MHLHTAEIPSVHPHGLGDHQKLRELNPASNAVTYEATCILVLSLNSDKNHSTRPDDSHLGTISCKYSLQGIDQGLMIFNHNNTACCIIVNWRHPAEPHGGNEGTYVFYEHLRADRSQQMPSTSGHLAILTILTVRLSDDKGHNGTALWRGLGPCLSNIDEPVII